MLGGDNDVNMNEARVMEEGLRGTAKNGFWKKHRGRVDELEMCLWKSTSDSVV